MPAVNSDVLKWARETAAFDLRTAAAKLDLKGTKGTTGADRLRAIEAGEELPSRPLLVRMAKVYRRSLITFYVTAPPPKGDRGQDFRTLPADRPAEADALLDTLVRDVTGRQQIVRSILEDDEEAEPLPFVGAGRMERGAGAAVAALKGFLDFSLEGFREQQDGEHAFAYLRACVERAGVFVLLIGNLGSHHSTIGVDTFRGFAIADKIAPFIVINDQDAPVAWSFSLLHELTHVWLGQTGVSAGYHTELAVEKFCNEVASAILLPASELAGLDVAGLSVGQAKEAISRFAHERRISRTLVAYRLLLSRSIDDGRWRSLSAEFRKDWLNSRELRKQRQAERKGGPNYYVIRRHRLGGALIGVVRRHLDDGTLSPTRASRVLGVKPRSVAPLVSPGGL